MVLPRIAVADAVEDHDAAAVDLAAHLVVLHDGVGDPAVQHDPVHLVVARVVVARADVRGVPVVDRLVAADGQVVAALGADQAVVAVLGEGVVGDRQVVGVVVRVQAVGLVIGVGVPVEQHVLGAPGVGAHEVVVEPAAGLLAEHVEHLRRCSGCRSRSRGPCTPPRRPRPRCSRGNPRSLFDDVHRRLPRRAALHHRQRPDERPPAHATGRHRVSRCPGRCRSTTSRDPVHVDLPVLGGDRADVVRQPAGQALQPQLLHVAGRSRVSVAPVCSTRSAFSSQTPGLTWISGALGQAALISVRVSTRCRRSR